MQVILESISRAFLTLGMLPRGGRIIAISLALLVSIFICTVFSAGLQNLEERFGSLGWTLDPDDSEEQRILLVSIDEKSVAAIGAWPWPRSEMARLVTALNEYGVQLQLHDIVYAEPNTGDELLVSALTGAQGAVIGAVIGQVPSLFSSQELKTGMLTHPVTGVSCESRLPQSSDFVAPHEGYSAVPKGHITPIISTDGAVRYVSALICVDGQPYPTMALSALLQGIGNDEWSVSVSAGRSLLSPAQILEVNGYPGFSVPLDEHGNMRVSFRKAPESFISIPAIDVMNKTVDSELLDNSWVLVGATAFGIGDVIPTPYSGATPGVELWARILTSLLDATVPYTPRFASHFMVVLVFLAGVFLYLLAGAREKISAYGLPIAGLLLPVAAFWLHVQLLMSMEIWFGWIFPSVFSICAASMLLLLEQGKLRSERGRVFSNLNSYLPGDVAKEIAYSLPSSKINAKRRDVTLLCADLRNFAAFGEARTPEESASILHFFFVKATEIVEKHGGRIQEFKGDGLLAVWDSQDSISARTALTAAQQMQEVISPCLVHKNLPSRLSPLALGIGIEQGPALIGSIGPANRRTHTLLGDTVTITLRIQEMTAELAQPILIGECASRQLSEFGLESQGSYLLSGLRIPHLLFALPAERKLPERHLKTQRLKIIKGGLG